MPKGPWICSSSGEKFNFMRVYCSFSPLALSVFVFKNVSKGLSGKLMILNLFYIAPFDIFYYVSLRKTLRASGLGVLIFFIWIDYDATAVPLSIIILLSLSHENVIFACVASSLSLYATVFDPARLPFTNE